MTFRLNGLGKLAEGIDEATAIASLKRLTGLSEEKIKAQLLNGQPRKLVSSEKRDEIEALKVQLTEAGLLVELVKDGATLAPPIEPQSRSLFGRMLPVVVFFLAVVLGAAGYGWYWLNQAPGPDVLATESALADGTLVAIGHVDVNKIVTLKKAWFGEIDPKAIPLPDSKQALLKRLFEGPARFTDNLDHLFLAVHSEGEGKKAASSLVLHGRFDAQAIVGALEEDYRLSDVGDSRWLLQPIVKSKSGISCPEKKGGNKPPANQPAYLHITPQQLIFSESSEQLEHLLLRLAQSPPPKQELTLWHEYRSGQLASLMIFVPGDASTAVGGFEGMILQNAAKEAPEVSHLAARVGVSPLSAGLLAGVKVGSSDAAWNSESAMTIREKLGEWSQQSEGVSPSLTQLLSRLSVDESAEQVQLELVLDGEMLSELGQAVEEAFASLFTFNLSGDDSEDTSAPISDKIDKSPIDYTANASLSSLPPYTVEQHETAPPFIVGSFAVGMDQLSLNDKGILVLKLEGETALPKVDHNIRRVGSLSMWVEEVKGTDGRSLLREEHCLDGPHWERDNHEVTVGKNMFNNRISVDKKVRLKPGVSALDIQSVTGRMSFSAPVKVKRFELPLSAGASVSHAGMRFYINQTKGGRSVSYQLSGDTSRFAELRALNVDGKPLRRGWRIGSEKSGRITQHYEGTIHALHLYVAETMATKSQTFTIHNLLQPPKPKNANRKHHWYAPASLPVDRWEQYTRLDMKNLHADPQDEEWHRWGSKEKPVALMNKAPLDMVLRHQPKEWGNRPEVEIYFPQIEAMPGVLSLLSYEVELPANEQTGKERFIKVSFPYYSGNSDNFGKMVTNHHIDKLPFARHQSQLEVGLKKNEKIERLKGAFQFRLPTRTESSLLRLDELWEGKTVGGVTVRLESIKHGMFPGYGLKIEGDLGRLVNVHGLDGEGKRIAADPVNFQSGGYWTMTLPFAEGMEQVELVLAAEQRVYQYPFDLHPKYAEASQ